MSNTDEPTDVPVTRRTRGPTKNKRIIKNRNKNIRVQVSLNEYGQPDDREQTNLLASELGKLVKCHVNITCMDWRRDVSAETKDSLWEMLLRGFEIPETEEMKQKFLSWMAKLFRDHKTKLTNTFITNKEKLKFPEQTPVGKYNITQRDWEIFVQQRGRDDFQELSRRNQERQRANVHTHYTSRIGMAPLIAEMKKAKRDQLLAENPEAIVDEADLEPPRKEVWVRSRTKKTGGYGNQANEEVVSRIESLSQEVTQGTFQVSGRTDVLTAALGTDEHPGRVRALGRGVGISKFFGKSSRPRQSGLTKEEIDARIDQEVERRVKVQEEEMELRVKAHLEGQMQERMEREMQARMEREVKAHMERQMKSYFERAGMTFLPEQEYIPQPPTSTSYPDDIFSTIGEKAIPCPLAIEEPLEDNIVAYGRVFDRRLFTTVHNRKLAEDHVRVSIVSDMSIGQVMLPVPIPDEMTTLHEAAGSTVPWPKRLVIILEMPEEEHRQIIEARKKKLESASSSHVRHSLSGRGVVEKDYAEKLQAVKQKKQYLDSGSSSRVQSQHGATTFDRLRSLVAGLRGRSLRIPFGDAVDVVGDNIYVDGKGITDVLDMQWIDTCVIDSFMRYLKDFTAEFEIEEEYGFLNSYLIRPNEMDCAVKYISSSLKTGKKCYLGPILERKHWMLFALFPEIGDVYWFDSIGKAPPSTVLHMLNTAFRINVKDKRMRELKWITVPCHLQRGSVECGYFVMRFMFEIVTRMDLAIDPLQHWKDILPPKVSKAKRTFHERDIIEIRRLWGNFILKESEGGALDDI